MLRSVRSGFINATDLADYLVTKGMPFREAHGVVGAAVRYCIDKGKDLDSLSLEEFKGFSDLIGDDVYPFIDVKNCVERRISMGGTSSASTDYQLMTAIQGYMQREDTVRQMNEFLDSCWNELLE